MLTGYSIYVVPRPGAVSATVILARHARHDEVGVVLSGRSDIALNTKGRAEARRLADRLANVPLAAVHSSPRRRCWQTAEVVAEPHGLAVTRADGLDELDFGRWAGERFDALDGDLDWVRWNAARGTAATPGGETMAGVAARATAVVVAVAGVRPVLCVSHADVIRAVVAQAMALPFDRVLEIDVDPTALTTLAVDGARVRCVTLNEGPR